ncbi:MAG: hypothetical protein RI945_97 [Candidatus Parcubacteria bacterium]|jgi:ribose 5-phosphate isomerase B
MKIYLAADHAGFEMKESIKLFLEVEKDELLKEFSKIGRVIQDLEIVDFGAYEYKSTDDYPKFISVCAGALSGDIYAGIKTNIAIVFGGSGEGEAIVADKYKGVRAGVVNSENIEIVKLLREHNDANILSIGARFISEDFAKKATRVFLLTNFAPVGEHDKKTRHERRIEEIGDIEETLNPKVSKEELDELNILQDMRNSKEDN